MGADKPVPYSEEELAVLRYRGGDWPMARALATVDSLRASLAAAVAERDAARGDVHALVSNAEDDAKEITRLRAEVSRLTAMVPAAKDLVRTANDMAWALEHAPVEPREAFMAVLQRTRSAMIESGKAVDAAINAREAKDAARKEPDA